MPRDHEGDPLLLHTEERYAAHIGRAISDMARMGAYVKANMHRIHLTLSISSFSYN